MCIYNLASDEATYCAAVMCYNASSIPTSYVLADTAAVPLLISILKKSPLLCTQLAIASLCNFSQHAQFHDQMREGAIRDVVNAIASPHLHISVKLVSMKYDLGHF